MIGALLLVLVLEPQAAQDLSRPRKAERVFTVESRKGTLLFVTANRSAVTAYHALRELEDLGAFRLNLEIPALKQTLLRESVGLAIKGKEAVSVAELIAVASGLDLITEREEPEEGNEAPGKLIATVVSSPKTDTSAGRERLRHWALRWYQNLMKAELYKNRETAAVEDRVRIDVALLHLAQGNLAAAANQFKLFSERAPDHSFVPEALLKEAECYLELGQYEDCRSKAHHLMMSARHKEVGSKAAVVLAKAYLRISEERAARGDRRGSRESLDRMAQLVGLFLDGFRERNEYPELILLLAEAHRRRGRLDLTLERIRQLENVIEPILLSAKAWATLQFLRGVAEAGSDNPELGEKLLWHFVQKNPTDARLGTAWLSLARTQLRMDDPLQCVFAAREALEHTDKLSPAERSEAVVLEAKGLIGLGRTKAAVDRLEVEVRKRGRLKAPGLVKYLAETLLDAGKPERAKVVLAGLEHWRGEFGDEIRLLVLRAEALQGNHYQVVKQAKDFAAEITRPGIQKRVSEMVGDAYSALGRKRLAAEAYSGRIR
ncbi:MAG: tol-pal system YbgF family protein [Planctomycetota bacterium]